MKKCELDIEQKTLKRIKKQIDNGELYIDDLKLVDLRKKYLEKVGFDIFIADEAMLAVYEADKKEGSFLLTKREGSNEIVRCLFKVTKEKDKTIVKINLIEIDPDFYGEE